ncbi:MAG: hypothetical protein JOY69_00050, partial [Candidatus Eremiobacteraeota bacterium]|nr:hypothetical protein [Candidatus Eremiobacteraeota bacterium]
MKRIYARDLQGPLRDDAFATLPADARVSWRTPLADADFERAMRWLREHPA